MTFNERITSGKPYVWGFVFGLVAAPIIAFSAGWVSTTGARADAVQNARVETLAGVCSDAAQKSWELKSTDLAAIKGYDNRVQRQELVDAALAAIQVPEELMTKVSNGCNRTLA